MIKVLIVEDEPVAAEATATYVARVPGFAVAGYARSGIDALRQLALTDIDLVLLDIHLPGISGLDVLRKIRAAGDTSDVIAVTRSGDLAVVRAAVSYGVVGYLIKPFTFSALRSKLESYQAYRAGANGRRDVVGQHEVDELLATLRAADPMAMPRGISRESLGAVVDALTAGGGGRGMSSAEMADVLGASRVTARRYLEYLVAQRVALRHSRYKGAGRPEVEYLIRRRGGVGDSHTGTALRG